MMNSKKFPGVFQGINMHETMKFSYHQHWIRLLWPFAKMVASTVVLIVIAYAMFALVDTVNSFARHLVLYALLAGFLTVQMEFIVRFYRYFLYVIVVTDKKIHRIKKTLLTTDDHQSLDLWTLQDIDKSQHGIIQSALGYGSIRLQAQDTELRLHFVPKITQRYQQLMLLREEARNASRHMESALPPLRKMDAMVR